MFFLLKVGAVSNLADQARRTIRSMSKREVQQKIMLWVIGLLLLGVVGTVLYLALKRI